MSQSLPSALPSTALPPPLLPQHLSQYTNPHLTLDSPDTTLEALAHLVRLAKYQERKRADSRLRLQRSLVSTALSSRLTRCGDIACRNLVDGFRKLDKDAFALLFNAIHDVRRSCDELRRYALLEPDAEEALSGPALASSTDSLDTSTASVVASAPPSPKPITPFLHLVSSSSRDAFVDFLCQIRSSPDYLAVRICALSSSELSALSAPHIGSESVESVLSFHRRSVPQPHVGAPSRTGRSPDVERLLSFQRHDALSLLIHSCFAGSAGPDSSEDQLRTEVWSTVLARLLQRPSSSNEHFLIAVLNIWTAMRDWSGKSNLEWYLMRILDEGAFILDRAEDQLGTRFNLSDWNQSDEAAAKDFYSRAVESLFELVDDDDATAIPEGLLELGNAIVRKLNDRLVENTSKWLVWRYLFYVFLLGALVHPEYHGMLADYHITPYARERIMKKVAMKAHEYVSSMWNGKPSATCVPVEVPAKIQAHVTSILSRFQGARSKSPAAKLLPARSVASLRETPEVRPYLVLSPVDLLTLVNALFPEQRPHSAGSSLRSDQASTSGLSALSQPISATHPRNAHETPSVISTSVSSARSESSISRDALSDGPDAALSPRFSPSVDLEAQRRRNRYEDDGLRLRLALHELGRTLGPGSLSGACHPCAERWVVLFISSNGRRLSTHMTYDLDGEDDEDARSSTVDSDDQENAEDEAELHLDRDFHQLRDSVLQLVEDFEIPRNLEPDKSEGAQLSNRASRLKRYGPRKMPAETTRSSRNPYRRPRGESGATGSSSSSSSSSDVAARANQGSLSTTEQADQDEPVLITMLKAASAQSEAQADFVASHVYWKALKQLNVLAPRSLRDKGFAALINIFSRGPRDSIRKSASAIEEYDAWLVWLKQSQERHNGLIGRMMRRVRAMRDKMWYTVEVRNSKEYAHSRDICQALKTMGAPRRRSSSFQRSRASTGRGPGASSYLYRAESQIMDLLAASPEQGGPNKLSDDQAEKTSLWLQRCGIENFCAGEERIHRFCCEVDRCISQLVGETIREAPVLWSGELYRRDKLTFDAMRAREREAQAAAAAAGASTDDIASILSDGSERRLSPSLGRPGLYARDARAAAYGSSSSSQHNGYESARLGRHHVGSGGGSGSGISLGHSFNGHDYAERASPLPTADSAGTFWSPFYPLGSVAYSPASSVTNVSMIFSGPGHLARMRSTSSLSMSMGLPGTTASSGETSKLSQRGVDDAKTRFLDSLRQSLTSLLLSDLGSLVLGRGSETDQWFVGLGQQCIDRSEAMVRQAGDNRGNNSPDRDDKERAGKKSSSWSRVIEKKNRCENLREAGETGSGGGVRERGSERPQPTNFKTPERSPDGRIAAGAQEAEQNFPFKKAYQRLLNMFCVHPNPHAKLKALNELQHLIMASQPSFSSRRSRASRSEALVATSVGEDDLGAGSRKMMQPDEKEGKIKERRGQVRQPGSANESRPPAPGTATVASEAVMKEWQTLFRDAAMRPKALFRDLQLIASFAPAAVLDGPERGKAFWSAGLAALTLKSDVCRTMMELADEAFAAHTRARTAPAADVKAASGERRTGGSPASSYKLADVGRMWVTTAREGYPTAQRELALFYLSNPEYVEQVTLPLSKPREVFKQTVMERYGRRGGAGTVSTGASSTRGAPSSSSAAGGAAAGSTATSSGAGGGAGGVVVGGSGVGNDGKSQTASGSKKDGGDVRNDAVLMCVAVHWMEAAGQGGDELAKNFLRQNEFRGLA